ncbi:MAG: hypothetical protein D6795_04925 [Deltaproteobacteria bacterium]|nr:MAG: hypothetical protein D6795_04925 [Deltaproteobacteria bacterium]
MSVSVVEVAGREALRPFEIAEHVFETRMRETKDGRRNWSVPVVPGLIVENVVAGRPWWRGFADFVSKEELKRRVFSAGEKGGLWAMVNNEEVFPRERRADLRRGVPRGMSAEAAKEEGNPAEAETKKGRRKARGTVRVRRARLEVTRAVSLTPFAGDITFNAASVGATPSASSTGKDPVPYGTEVHATRYQYGFALTPEDLTRKERVFDVIGAVTELSEVAGNQARFLFDFSPDAVLFRWTEDFAPRILYGFALDEDGRLSLPAALGRIEAGDIAPAEVVVGGSIAGMPDGERLRELGCEVVPGVREAAWIAVEPA